MIRGLVSATYAPIRTHQAAVRPAGPRRAATSGPSTRARAGSPDKAGARPPAGAPAAGGPDTIATVSSLRLGPRPFLRLCQFTLAVTVLNIATGAAVRLSDSGLGLPGLAHLLPAPPDPAAQPPPGHRVRQPAGGHRPGGGVRRHPGGRPAPPPRRRDLTWLAGGLILGVIGEAVLGAFVVYSKLNAYVVATHFMVGMALLAVAVVLTLRAAHGPGRGTAVVSVAALLAGRGCWWPCWWWCWPPGPPPPGPGPTPAARAPSGSPSASRT